MRSALRETAWPWAGLVGGAAFWYAAHELGFYVAGLTCSHTWVAPSIQVMALLGAISCGVLSWESLRARTHRPARRFAAAASSGVAAIFALVIFWQAMASLVYDGCAR